MSNAKASGSIDLGEKLRILLQTKEGEDRTENTWYPGLRREVITSSPKATMMLALSLSGVLNLSEEEYKKIIVEEVDKAMRGDYDYAKGSSSRNSSSADLLLMSSEVDSPHFDSAISMFNNLEHVEHGSSAHASCILMRDRTSHDIGIIIAIEIAKIMINVEMSRIRDSWKHLNEKITDEKRLDEIRIKASRMMNALDDAILYLHKANELLVLNKFIRDTNEEKDDLDFMYRHLSEAINVVSKRKRNSAMWKGTGFGEIDKVLKRINKHRKLGLPRNIDGSANLEGVHHGLGTRVGAQYWSGLQGLMETIKNQELSFDRMITDRESFLDVVASYDIEKEREELEKELEKRSMSRMGVIHQNELMGIPSNMDIKDFEPVKEVDFESGGYQEIIGMSVKRNTTASTSQVEAEGVPETVGQGRGVGEIAGLPDGYGFSPVEGLLPLLGDFTFPVSRASAMPDISYVSSIGMRPIRESVADKASKQRSIMGMSLAREVFCNSMMFITKHVSERVSSGLHPEFYKKEIEGVKYGEVGTGPQEEMKKLINKQCISLMHAHASPKVGLLHALNQRARKLSLNVDSFKLGLEIALFED